MEMVETWFQLFFSSETWCNNFCKLLMRLCRVLILVFAWYIIYIWFLHYMTCTWAWAILKDGMVWLGIFCSKVWWVVWCDFTFKHPIDQINKYINKHMNKYKYIYAVYRFIYLTFQSSSGLRLTLLIFIDLPRGFMG
jgi:hypothetical protein